MPVTRAVLDPNVLVSARISPTGTPARVLLAAEEGRYELVISEGLLGEVGEVLQRPKFRRYLPEEEVETYLQRLRQVATVFAEVASGSEMAKIEGAPVSTADPKDDYLLALGLDRTIVSGDRHLLDVGELRDSTGEIRIRVVSPQQFLEQHFLEQT